MRISQEDLKTTMQGKTDEELYLLLHVQSRDYTAEAIKAAQEEFGRRQLNAQTMSRVVSVADQKVKAGAEDGRRAERKPAGTFKETVKSLVFGLGFLAVISLLVSGIFYSYKLLDSTGWISHNHDTPVWIHGEWMVGEYRDCGMLTTTSPAGVALSPTVRAELPRLFCGKQWEGMGIEEFQLAMPNYTGATNAIWHGSDWNEFDGNFHVLPVRYFGRINRPDAVFISWRCQRLSGGFLESSSIECKALD